MLACTPNFSDPRKYTLFSSKYNKHLEDEYVDSNPKYKQQSPKPNSKST